MLKNYLKIAFRNLVKRKVTSLVNLLGLSIGITLTVLLILYAQYELDYDKFHHQPEQTYRLLRMEDLGNNTQIVAKTSPRIMLSLTEEFSEIESTTLLFKHWNVPLLSQEDNGFYEKDFLFADSSFFDVFGYELLLGDPETALSEPNSLVITERMAKKYFGDEDPLGRVLRYELKYDLVITGVVKEVRDVGAHFEFDFLASMPTLTRVMNSDVLTGAYNGFYSYIHFRPGTDIKSFNTRHQEWLFDRFPEERIRLQPLLDIHLRSDAIAEIEEQSDIMFVRVVLIIAIIVIILATINYINSAVSTSVERLKEMGVRMVSGAFAQHIYFQFILEAILTISISIVMSLIALFFMITPFNGMLDTNLILNPIVQWDIWLVIAGLIFLTAIISGMAPAIVIIRMELTDVLLNVVTLGRIGYLRKGLMIFQFVVSVVLIVGAVTINRQADFVKSKDLGFDQSSVMIIPIRDRGVHIGYQSFKDDVLGIAGVTSVSRASTVPGRPYATNYYKLEPAALDSILMNVGDIDDHYFQSLGIRLLTGTDFEFLKDESINPVVVNETVLEAFELGDPLEALGKPMYYNGEKYMIVGVIQDFNYETLHNRIQPLVFQPGVALEDYMIIKYQGVDEDQVAEQVSGLWYETAYEQPFTRTSLTNDLASLYQSEKIWGDIGNLSMIVSVVIGALGVFGLVSLVVQKRFKEMGLRKIFGASHGNIIGIIYSEFLSILFVTFLIAVPLAYFLSQLWLQDFAYRIAVPIDGFVIAIALLASVTCLAVLFHTLRALTKDPINALSD